MYLRFRNKFITTWFFLRVGYIETYSSRSSVILYS